ncbi:MAG TPA: pilus assembly protein [Desulfotomaculum sp.]|nr:MAG: hypothetical protein JL56_04300 [Desulfotomaculum sp. BICA1-6]HBX24061.1 pilus assembly protein [Desulfotomaculum sp.]
MKILKREDGAALVEFALVVMLLLMIVFSIIEFGRIFHAQLVVTHAAREGARVGVVTNSANRDSQAVSTAVSRGASISLAGSNVSTSTSGDQFTVTVNYAVDILTPIMSGIITDPLPITGSAVMRIE